jgi:acyl-CoA reductase-like NAD-dependent aldehyde dehydrogenase
MKIINPATEQLIQEVKEDQPASVQAKYEAARQAQVNWAKTTLEHRVACIQKFHDLIEKNQERLATDLTSEVGKPIQEAMNELNGVRTRIRFFIENAAKWLTPSPIRVDGTTAESISFDALGVIANISAWNYPYLVGVNVFIPALIAGNAVLYKPSEFSTITGLNIEKLLHEAGIPTAVFSAVIGDYRVGEVLLDLPLDGYFFTGSYKTGKHIAERVASKLVPVGLELGGKDPLYVTDEVADLKQVANAVAEGCFYNNGQSCCAVERVYVHQNVYDQFITLFEQEVKALKVGNPMDRAHQQGSLTRPSHIGFIESQIQDAITKGAKILCGGKRIAGQGAFFEPTVLTHVHHQMKVMTEESFGPIIGVMKVSDDQEAIRLMNDCEYGLTASVYTQNKERGTGILSQVNSGTSYLNCCDRVSPYLPWAGRKNSGLGATLSYLGILAFAKPRGWHVRG